MNGSAPYKSLQDWLQPHSEQFDALLGRVRLLGRLTGVLRGLLPEPLAGQCLAANLEDGTLVIGCRSSAWAAKLRYQLPDLLSGLQARPELPVLTRLRVRVQPLGEDPIPAAPRRPRLSPHNAALISAMAEGTADPALKAALLRLSRRTPAAKKS